MKESLLPLLDTEPWQLMRLIADQCLDAGDEALAQAWHWLADRHKWPGSARGIWRWSQHDSGRYQGSASWCLPVEVWRPLCARVGRIGLRAWEFRSCQDALVAAAEELARLVQNGVKIEELE